MLIDQIYSLEVVLLISMHDLSFYNKSLQILNTHLRIQKVLGDLLGTVQHGFIFLFKVRSKSNGSVEVTVNCSPLSVVNEQDGNQRLWILIARRRLNTHPCTDTCTHKHVFKCCGWHVIKTDINAFQVLNQTDRDMKLSCDLIRRVQIQRQRQRFKFLKLTSLIPMNILFHIYSPQQAHFKKQDNNS